MTVSTSTTTQEFLLPERWMDGRERVEGLCIDKINSKVIDDAVHISHDSNGKYFTLSVPDITLLPTNMVGRAIAIGSAVPHVGKRVSQIYPRYICENTLSLRGPSLKPSVSFEVEVDPNDGKAMNLRIFKSIIEPKNTLLKDVDAFLSRNIAPKASVSDYEMLRDLYETLERLNLVKEPDDYGASRLVKLANVIPSLLLADLCAQKQIQLLRRVYNGKSVLINNKEVYAHYSPEIKGHINYGRSIAHANCPLRRGADTVNILNVISHLDGLPPVFDLVNLRKIGDHLSLRNRDAILEKKKIKKHFRQRASEVGHFCTSPLMDIDEPL